MGDGIGGEDALLDQPLEDNSDTKKQTELYKRITARLLRKIYSLLLKFVFGIYIHIVGA